MLNDKDISLKDYTTHYSKNVYQNFINEFIKIGNKDERNETNGYKIKVRTRIIVNKFMEYTKDILPLFKIKEYEIEDKLLNKELQQQILGLTKCEIAYVRYSGISYRSFIGIELKN